MVGCGKGCQHNRLGIEKGKMVKNSFSTKWRRSTQPRKQRKYSHNAPLHIKQKMMHVHLSKELREKYGFRNVQLRKGDKVKVLRGQFTKKEGKVERVDLKRGNVFITGIETVKKDGTKLIIPFSPSNLMIVDLDLSDKKRRQKLESRKGVAKEKAKKGAKEEERPVERAAKESKELETVPKEGEIKIGSPVKVEDKITKKTKSSSTEVKK